MASWEQKTLAESGVVDNIVNTAAAAAETVTDLATQVQEIATVAKAILGGFSDPIGAAISAAAQLVQRSDTIVHEAAIIIELEGLGGREKPSCPAFSLMRFTEE